MTLLQSLHSFPAQPVSKASLLSTLLIFSFYTTLQPILLQKSNKKHITKQRKPSKQVQGLVVTYKERAQSL